MSRPRLLDCYCGAGGASAGYHRAGFDVTGVDIAPQPRYPFAFIQTDALEYIAAHGHEYDAIAASPPCQQYTRLRSLHKRTYPDLIALTRDALRAAGRPYIIENVPGAPLIAPVVLCGTMFAGLRVYRHRLFECSFFLLSLPHSRHRVPTMQRGYCADWPGFVTVTGGHNVPKSIAAAAIGIDWMTREELSQAIPPAYTEFLGCALLAHLGGQP